MAAKEEVSESERFVYRISTAEEWHELQRSGTTFGGQLDKSSGFIHLSTLHQVQSTLQNFFVNTEKDLYLLQIDSKKLGDGLIYEVVDGSNTFPHFYGPSRGFSPLPLDAVTRAEKLSLSGGTKPRAWFKYNHSPIDALPIELSLTSHGRFLVGDAIFHLFATFGPRNTNANCI